jgi:CelD/BcsL family acetyltransferase involved in cellulose biosynthesis
MMHLRELTPDDAPAIALIESARHQRVLADGADSHRVYLTDALADGVNLSFGAFDGDRLVGYLLCYGFEPAECPGETGHVLYVEDYAVLPSYRRVAPPLLKRFAEEARKHFPGVPLEAHSVNSVVQLWEKHVEFGRRIGFDLSRHELTGEVIGGQTRHLVRWEPIAGFDPAARDLAQLLEKLPRHDMELDGVPYALHVLHQEADWTALQTVWDDLLLATPEHTVFQSYAYQRLWWRHFGSDNELFIVLILRDGVIRGIAPLQIQAVKYHGRYCRHLSFIGSRWEVDRPTFLFPGDASGLLRVLVALLAHLADKWNVCELHEQVTGSEPLRILEEAFRAAGYLVARTPDSNCPYLAIAGTWQEFLMGKSQTFRKNLKTAARRLRSAGEVQYRVYDTPATTREQLDVYRDIEGRSWKSAEGVGVSRSEDYFEFYREMADAFGSRRGFVIRILTVNEQPVAGTFGLEFDGIYYSLQIAHDREFSRSSPGTYLEGLEMEECFGRGYREYEFLGGFLNNKSRWTTTFRYTTQLHVFRRTPFFRALHLFHFRVKPWVKDLIRPYMKSWHQSTAPAEPDE